LLTLVIFFFQAWQPGREENYEVDKVSLFTLVISFFLQFATRGKKNYEVDKVSEGALVIFFFELGYLPTSYVGHALEATPNLSKYFGRKAKGKRGRKGASH